MDVKDSECDCLAVGLAPTDLTTGPTLGHKEPFISAELPVFIIYIKGWGELMGGISSAFKSEWFGFSCKANKWCDAGPR